MTTKVVDSYPKFDTWISTEVDCTKETFEKINAKLSYYVEKAAVWDKAVFGELVSDVKALEKSLVGRVSKLEEEKKKELEPLMAKTRELLQNLSDQKNVMYYSTYIYKYDTTSYQAKFNLRRTLNTLQWHLFASDSECVEKYAEKLRGYPEKLKEWNVHHKIPYEFEELEYDLTAYSNVLMGRVDRLNKEEVEKLKPLLSQAHAALEKVKKDKTISYNFQCAMNTVKTYDKNLENYETEAALGTVQFGLSSQAGSSLDLYRLFSFASLFDKPFGRNVVLKSDGIDMEMSADAVGKDQEVVRECLKSVKLALEVPATVKHLQTSDLLKMKIACGFLMANYEKFMIKEKALTFDNFHHLSEINETINKRLAERKEEVGPAIKELPVKQHMLRMLAHLSDNTYFPKFWKEEKHVRQLEALLDNVGKFVKTLSDSDALSVDGLVFLKEIEVGDTGLRLRIYEPERDFRRGRAEGSEETSEIVVFCSGTEKDLSYWNVLQSREVKDFNVLGHKPVLDNAEKAVGPLTEYLKKEATFDAKALKNVTFAGFGLDGAVSQLLAYKVAGDLKSTAVSSYSLGTPAFLDRNSAAKIASQKNLYAINFTLAGDSKLKTNYKLLKPVQNKWCDWSSYIYPLYNSNWFFTEDWGSGHSENNYFANARDAITLPLELYKVYRESDVLLHPENQSI